jgi:hypothetical protein
MIEDPLQLEDDISHKNCIRELRRFQRLLIDQSNDNEESIAALESRVKALDRFCEYRTAPPDSTKEKKER